MLLLLVTVIGTGVGCRGLFAAVPNNDGFSSGQQIERHGRTHSMMSSSNSSNGVKEWADRVIRQPELYGSAPSRAGGDRSDQTGEFVFTMDPCFDRSIVFGRIWRLFFTASVGPVDCRRFSCGERGTRK